ncbi:unnamed protein product [Ceratitis capitata]|uniref:(Mediterranean fruit fly) hypothetical protein n=1 Tax=Ceratitis capitata TaxID=7213 RepID=A0A811TY19_CERCA|nr:unnamed protein product [Ceratitis capitata]
MHGSCGAAGGANIRIVLFSGKRMWTGARGCAGTTAGVNTNSSVFSCCSCSAFSCSSCWAENHLPYSPSLLYVVFKFLYCFCCCCCFSVYVVDLHSHARYYQYP